MFFGNNTIAHTDVKLRAVTQDTKQRQAEQFKTPPIQQTHRKYFARISLLALTLLSGAGIFAIQLSTPAFADETNADAAAKMQKKKGELANPNSYVLKQRQMKADPKASEAAILEKKKSDYDKLSKSVKALSQALKRESEKAGVNNTEILAEVESSSKDAARYATTGAYDKALQTLGHGYDALTAEIVKLENLKGQGEGAKTDKALAAKPVALPTDPRDAVAHEIKTNKALLDALKRQNEDKAGGKEIEIGAIKATANEASAALEAGDIARAEELIHDANSRTKIAIASLQKTPNMLAGSEALEAAHQHDAEVKEENIRDAYAKRKASVAALLDAGKRVDIEHGTSHAAFAKADSMLKDAEELAAADKFAEGKAQLDRAYQLLKDTMRNMLSLKEPAAVEKSPATKTKKQRVKVRTDSQQ